MEQDSDDEAQAVDALMHSAGSVPPVAVLLPASSVGKLSPACLPPPLCALCPSKQYMQDTACKASCVWFCARIH